MEEAPDPSAPWPSLLDLEELDRNLYRAFTPPDPTRPNLFGGQVAAQALRAASLTVPDGRPPHSLHGYFLRQGRLDRPIILRVSRDRDGRSFSARRVVADQNGEAIFTMLASFHHPEPAGDFQPPAPPDVPPPEELPAYEGSEGIARFVELRYHNAAADDHWAGVANLLWARARGPLPEDPIFHASVLAFVSDLGSGFVGTAHPGVPQGGPSLDHAMWFHRPLDLSDWVLMSLWPLSAAGARGLYEGAIFDRQGVHGASLTQESLLRPPRAQ